MVSSVMLVMVQFVLAYRLDVPSASEADATMVVLAVDFEVRR
jgi:hypothetical protein